MPHVSLSIGNTYTPKTHTSTTETHPHTLNRTITHPQPMQITHTHCSFYFSLHSTPAAFTANLLNDQSPHRLDNGHDHTQTTHAHTLNKTHTHYLAGMTATITSTANTIDHPLTKLTTHTYTATTTKIENTHTLTIRQQWMAHVTGPIPFPTDNTSFLTGAPSSNLSLSLYFLRSLLDPALISIYICI